MGALLCCKKRKTQNCCGQAQVPEPQHWHRSHYTAIAAGARHSVLLRRDGAVLAVGDGSLGQTAIPNLPHGVAYSAVAAGDLHTVLLRTDGEALAVGSSSHAQTAIPNLPCGVRYTAIAAGPVCTVLRRSDGRVVREAPRGGGAFFSIELN